MSNKLRVGVLAVAALALGSASAVSAVSPSPESAEGGGTIAVVTHGQAADPFWSVFKRGVDDAAAQMGVTANYSAPATFDMTEMASLIDAAVATEPDGLVVSVPDYPALQDSLARGQQAGIPIITVNSGSDHCAEIGAITHIGQDEVIAGRRARGGGSPKVATRALHPPRARATSLDAGAPAPRRRSRRPAGRSRSARSTSMTPPGSPARSAPRCRPTTRSTQSSRSARRRRPRPWRHLRGSNCSAVRLPFDLSADVIQAIIDGNMEFAIDQQQYLQGYLPIVFLKLYNDNLNTVGGGLPVYAVPVSSLPRTPSRCSS